MRSILKLPILLTILTLASCDKDYTTNNITQPGPDEGPIGAALGRAGSFAVLSGSAISNTGSNTVISGDIGVSPGSSVTGVPVNQPSGKTYIAAPEAAEAQAALTSVYNNLAGRPCDATLTGDLGARTLSPGVYCLASSAGISGPLTLHGPPNSSFIFQIGSTLTTGPGAAINMSGGAKAKNVYWQVGSSATLGTGTAFRGNIIALQSITAGTGSSVHGRLLARNGGVTLDDNSIRLP